MQQITFTVLHGLMILRKGIRANSYEHIYTGKNKLSVLLFGRNHPHYQQLVSFEKMIEALMPREIRALKYSSLVLSRTGRSGHNQSGDAVIEEINKEAKRDLVGVPNETQWKRSFHNLDMMNTLRAKTLEDAGVSDQKEGNYSSCKNIAIEVKKIRTLLRETQYLENATDFRPHLGLGTNIELSVNLVKFYEVAFSNLRENLPKILKSEPSNINVLYSTLDEENRKLYDFRD